MTESLAADLGVVGPGRLVAFGSSPGASAPPPPPCSLHLVERAGDPYAVQELGNLGGNLSAAKAINDSRTIVGDGNTAPHRPPMPWLWAGGHIEPLPIPLDSFGYAHDINDASEVVGAVVTPEAGHLQHAWYWDSVSGKSRDLDGRVDRESLALAINARSVIAGSMRMGYRQEGSNDSFPSVWRAPSASGRVLRDLGRSSSGSVRDISNSGELLIAAQSGLTRIDVAVGHAEENRVELLTAEEARGWGPVAMSSDGRLILASSGRAYYLKVHGVEKWKGLDCPPGSHAADVNKHGDVVGSVIVDGFYRPWLKPFQGALVMLPYAEFHDTQPSDTSDSGLICGTASTDHGSHALLWEPTATRSE